MRLVWISTDYRRAAGHGKGDRHVSFFLAKPVHCERPPGPPRPGGFSKVCHVMSRMNRIALALAIAALSVSAAAQSSRKQDWQAWNHLLKPYEAKTNPAIPIAPPAPAVGPAQSVAPQIPGYIGDPTRKNGDHEPMLRPD
jgi:hypothetical protein